MGFLSVDGGKILKIIWTSFVNDEESDDYFGRGGILFRVVRLIETEMAQNL